MSSNLEDAMRFAVLLARYAPAGHPDHWIVRDALAIGRDARTVARIAVDGCNRELSPREVKRGERAEERISRVLRDYRSEARFEGDPRGYVVKARFPGGESNGAIVGSDIRAWGIS